MPERQSLWKWIISGALLGWCNVARLLHFLKFEIWAIHSFGSSAIVRQHLYAEGAELHRPEIFMKRTSSWRWVGRWTITPLPRETR